jgi:hypothetical protein
MLLSSTPQGVLLETLLGTQGTEPAGARYFSEAAEGFIGSLQPQRPPPLPRPLSLVATGRAFGEPEEDEDSAGFEDASDGQHGGGDAHDGSMPAAGSRASSSARAASSSADVPGGANVADAPDAVSVEEGDDGEELLYGRPGEENEDYALYSPEDVAEVSDDPDWSIPKISSMTAAVESVRLPGMGLMASAAVALGLGAAVARRRK